MKVSLALALLVPAKQERFLRALAGTASLSR
jgi:hypothetical protein